MTTKTIKNLKVIMTKDAEEPFVYVLKERLKVKNARPSKFRIEAHKILMRDEDYGEIKRHFDYLEATNKTLALPLRYEIHKESFAFGDGTYE